MSGKRGKGEGSVHRRANGTWQCQVMDGYTDEGKRRIVSFSAPTRAEALAKMQAYLLDKPTHTEAHEPEIPLFVDYAQLWYDSYRSAPIPDLPDRKTICIMERGNEKCQPKNENTQRRRVTMRPSRQGQCGWSPSRGGPAGRWPRNSASASTRCAAG